MLDEVLTADDDITVVGTARNGEQAYEMILDKKPDVVLLDLVMPGIDGLGVMDKVHAEKNAESMPSFLLLSANCSFIFTFVFSIDILTIAVFSIFYKSSQARISRYIRQRTVFSCRFLLL